MRDVLRDAEELLATGEPVAVAMVVDTRRSAPRPLGSRLLVTASGEMRGSVSGGCVESDVVLRAQEVLRTGQPQLVPYGSSDDDAFDVGLPCGGEIEVFIATLDGEEVARARRAAEQHERLSVTTTLSGADASRRGVRPLALSTAPALRCAQVCSSARTEREGDSGWVRAQHCVPSRCSAGVRRWDSCQRLRMVSVRRMSVGAIPHLGRGVAGLVGPARYKPGVRRRSGVHGDPALGVGRSLQ